MPNDDALEQLQALGFGEYEARAYLTLLQRGPLTGYQLARASVIPRPNIYPVLDRLQQRGAVSRIEVKGGTRYAALPAQEMLARLQREMSGRLAKARDAMTAIAQAPAGEQVWNVQGYEAMMARAGALIDRSRGQLLVGVWSQEAAVIAGALAAAQQRGVDVATLCFQGCPDECGGCRGEIYRYPLAAGPERRLLVLGADEEELLVGQALPDGSAAAVVTRLAGFVLVGTHYLRHAIAAAEIVRSLGPRLGSLLDQRAQRALKGTGLAMEAGSWYESMLSAVGRS